MPDDLARKRIERQRRIIQEAFESGNIGAAEFVARSTVLDADSKAALEAPTVSGVTSEQAWSYRNDLASTFADADEQERSDLIHALYGRVDVLGPDIVSATLTPARKAMHSGSLSRKKSE